MTKRLLERVETEQIRREEALLDVPSTLAEAMQAIEGLRVDVRDAQAQVDELDAKLQAACTWRAKLQDYVIGGVFGGLVGSFLSRVF